MKKRSNKHMVAVETVNFDPTNVLNIIWHGSTVQFDQRKGKVREAMYKSQLLPLKEPGL